MKTDLIRDTNDIFLALSKISQIPFFKKEQVVRRAFSIALAAHMGQSDKQGVPYILHPIRVAGEAVKLTRPGLNKMLVCMVGLLHDVVEDTPYTMVMLADVFGHCPMLESVAAITRLPLEPYYDYLERCARDEIAAVVKLADLRDNSCPTRSFGSLDNWAIHRIRHREREEFLLKRMNA